MMHHSVFMYIGNCDVFLGVITPSNIIIRFLGLYGDNLFNHIIFTIM